MSAKTEFRKNFKTLLKEKQHTASSFSVLSGISRQKIQRLSDTSVHADGAIDLDDADIIAAALGTTLGYMCGNKYTDYMLDQTKMMYDYFELRKEVRIYIQKALDSANQEDQIHEYLAEILSSVDALHHRTKKSK
tara:strand:- start:781 stop:1185 length:405 start_codon:yes stop_codon:yes gene_type:complete